MSHKIGAENVTHCLPTEKTGDYDYYGSWRVT